MKVLRIIIVTAMILIFLSIPTCAGGEVYEVESLCKTGQFLFATGFLTLLVAVVLHKE